MHEGRGCTTGSDVSGSYVDGVSSDVNVAGIVGDKRAIDHEVVYWVRVNVQYHSPVAIERNVVSRLGNDSSRPLSSVAPAPDEVLLDESAGGEGAEELTNNPVDLSVLEKTSVLTALADLEHS